MEQSHQRESYWAQQSSVIALVSSAVSQHLMALVNYWNVKNNLQKLIGQVFVQPIFAIEVVKSEVFSSFLCNYIIAFLLHVFSLIPGQIEMLRQ